MIEEIIKIIMERKLTSRTINKAKKGSTLEYFDANFQFKHISKLYTKHGKYIRERLIFPISKQGIILPLARYKERRIYDANGLLLRYSWNGKSSGDRYFDPPGSWWSREY